jgi:hypothetical protein
MDSNDEILEDCFEESSNSITKLIEQPWIMNTIEIQKKNSIFKIEDFDSIPTSDKVWPYIFSRYILKEVDILGVSYGVN